MNIVCFSTSDWSYPIGSRQQIMRRLAKRHRVLFVEYQASWLHPLRYQSLRKRLGSAGRLRQISPSLWTYVPPLLAPFGTHLRWLNKRNQRRLAEGLKPVLARIGFQKPLLWIYTPLAADVIGKLGERGVVYHAIEAHGEEKENIFRKKTLQAMELELLRQTDLVFVMSEHLAKSFRVTPKKTCLLPSAVDEITFFKTDGERPARDNGDFHRIPPPRLGLIGNLDARKIDISLLESVMRLKKDWSLVLLGRLLEGHSAFQRLFKLSNVHYLGEQSPSTIPYFLKGMDVCLIPYRIDAFTRGISPLKLFEYLAVGRPVVSTPLEESKRMNEWVYVAEDNTSFVDRIQDAMEEGDEKKKARIDFAQQNTWKRRTETIEALLQETFSC